MKAMLNVLVDAACRIVGFYVPLLVLVLVVAYVYRRARFCAVLRRIPGPPALPILGNSLLLTGGQDDFFRLLSQCAEKYGDIFRLWIGQRPFVFLYRAEAIQPILNSNEHIDKSYEYNFLLPWLGTGLLTSTGEKWHMRRKLLTPSFHSRILEDFLEPIYRESLILSCRLKLELDKPSFDIMPYVKLCALDVICDTAMGTKMNAQSDSKNEYVVAIDRLTEILQRRFITPWLKPDSIFKRSIFGKKQVECLKIIHEFTGRVIKEHKEKKEQQNFVSEFSQPNGLKKKQRLALLDLLLEVSQDGRMLSDKDIREEVDTFTFAGHDTIAAGVGWCLYVLGQHLDVQDKIVKELRNVVEEEPVEWPTIKQLQKLGYLERCIKESLRLYPVVPLIARDIKQPVQILNHTLPPGVTVLMNSYILHRDPRFFPNPDVFEPDRFLLESCETRHPFAYIPFSAGSRNCIGQRFAMLELKVILSTLLSQYVVKSVDSEEQLNLMGELVLLNKGGIRLAITSRT